MNKLLVWVNERLPVVNAIKNQTTNYLVPKNFNLLYVFGALSLLVFVNQFVTGLWLTMFYIPSAQDAFDSVEYIMRDVHFGWLLRYMHTTGASMFFIVVYIHMFRSLLYGSYQKPRELVWLIGMGLFVLLMMEAFFGYLLPWGQLSYWGAQVITSLFSVIPGVGDTIVTWIRGDFSVSGSTLGRFFALHIVAVPFLLIFLVYLHVVALHHVGANNPEGTILKKADYIPFHPFYTLKDSVAALTFLLVFFAIVFFLPEMGGIFIEPDNFVPANPLQTPAEISPVWYLAPFYSILRAIPNKTLGVIALQASIILLFFLPWLDNNPVKSMRHKGYVARILLLLFCISFIVLGVLGKRPVTYTSQIIARWALGFYFLYFLSLPLLALKKRNKHA